MFAVRGMRRLRVAKVAMNDRWLRTQAENNNANRQMTHCCARVVRVRTTALRSMNVSICYVSIISWNLFWSVGEAKKNSCSKFIQCLGYCLITKSQTPNIHPSSVLFVGSWLAFSGEHENNERLRQHWIVVVDLTLLEDINLLYCGNYIVPYGACLLHGWPCTCHSLYLHAILRDILLRGCSSSLSLSAPLERRPPVKTLKALSRRSSLEGR